MKKIFLAILILIPVLLNGQTLSETQMRNARATGYAIVAARNPGVSFTIIVIPWDGVNTLENNANNQINSSWHAQAAVKGNYFNQEFDGTDFSYYSSVVISETDFDLYKNAGTQWWIICSTLPAFSNSINSLNGNIGIGTTTPLMKLHINNGPNSDAAILATSSEDNKLIVSSGFTQPVYCETFRISQQFYESRNNGYISFYRGGGINGGFLTFGTNGIERIRINTEGNVGIGNTDPGSYKLNVSGKIRANEIVVNTNGADFVFGPEYNLPDLTEVEEYIEENKHLPGVPSAAIMKEEGMSISEMQTKLLEKIEELTLYTIDQKKTLEKERLRNDNLENEIKELKELISIYLPK